MNQRFQQMKAAFLKRYGTQPVILVRAPGRVDLMGSHTDYNQGYVLTMTIDRDIWIAARKRPDHQAVFHSMNLEGGSGFSLEEVLSGSTQPTGWLKYIRGVAAALAEKGYPLQGVDALVHSTVPLGSGLSSSAALEVSTATLFQQVGGWEIEPLELALLCQRAENVFVGMNCGILDQYTSTMGKAGCAVLLDCRALSHTPAPISSEITIFICDTKAKRELTGSEYPQRRAQCEEGARLLSGWLPGVKTLRDVPVEAFSQYQDRLPAETARRCRFILEENQRVLDLAVALQSGSHNQIAQICASSFAGADTLYEIVSDEMRAMMRAMLGAPGVIGARQAGAGFGGCMVAFVDGQSAEAFSRHVLTAYAAATGIKADVYPVKPVDGAGLLNL